MKELKDTVELMCSKDYKDRMIAEYVQNYIRLQKLLNIYFNWNRLDFEPTCSKGIIKNQIDIMTEYLNILEIRLNMEGIEINEDYTN